MRTVTAVVVLGAVLAAWLCCTGCSRPPDQSAVAPPMPESEAQPGPQGAAATISQVGSTTVLPLAEKWRDEFNQQHPEVNLAVSGGGSGAGIEALSNKSARIANASREIKTKEKESAAAKGVNPVEHLVAYDGIAVIVTRDNPLTEISVQKLSDIYTGKITNWKDVGGTDGEIVVIGREAGSGTRDGFESITSTKDKCQYRQELTSTGDVITTVSKNANAIGYASLAEVKSSVVALTVDGVAPTEATVKDGSYKIQRPFVLVTKTGTTLSAAAKAFFDYATSADASAIITKAGAVPTK